MPYSYVTIIIHNRLSTRRQTDKRVRDKSLHQTLHAEKLVRASGIDIIDRSTIGSTRSRCTFASSRDTCFANAPYNRCQQQFLQHVSTSWSIIKDLNPSFVSHRLIDSLIFCTSFYGRLLRLALTFRFTVRPTQMASPL